MSHIYDPVFDFTELECPNKCGDQLDFYPKQSGPCLSGCFMAHMEATYFCATCEQDFDPEEVPNYMDHYYDPFQEPVNESAFN